jgi:hypothetical protein
MLHFYEVVVRSDGRDRVVRRVPTQRAADRIIAEMIRADLVSSKAIRSERRRGLHPWSVALICGGLSFLALFVPFVWLRVGLTLMLIALTLGFSTSGRRWIGGGHDDR